MIDFMVVAVRRADLSHAEFRRYFEDTHGPLAEQIPGLVGYQRFFPVNDPDRGPPQWDAIVRLRFADMETMEAGWSSPAGRRASADNANLMDLERSSWAVSEVQELR